MRLGVLFRPNDDSETNSSLQVPDCFQDLYLDQVVNASTKNMDEYDLKPLYYSPLLSVETVHYRQDVSRDLEDQDLLGSIRSFGESMHSVRRKLEQIKKIPYNQERERWYLDTAEIYCSAARKLNDGLSKASLKSEALLSFAEHLAGYVSSNKFKELEKEVSVMLEELSTVRYSVVIKGMNVKVSRYDSEEALTPIVESTFERFKQNEAKDYTVNYRFIPGLNHVEAQILELVARLYPEIFTNLEAFYEKHKSFLDSTVIAFDRDIHFYLSYMNYISKMKESGLEFCIPEICTTDKRVYAEQTFDLALANQLVSEDATVVRNDFSLDGAERILVVTGPNQGGKTTFARTFGQLHWLACLGLPVPGHSARLFLFDHVFTHFEREEEVTDLRGKLEDDLLRIRKILDNATNRSVIIMNEILTSTTIEDSLFLSRKILSKLIELDALGAWVTFLDELTTISEKTVSMVSEVDPENPAVRTFKITRKPADGLAYALSIADKYGLTYTSLRERVGR